MNHKLHNDTFAHHLKKNVFFFRKINFIEISVVPFKTIKVGRNNEIAHGNLHSTNHYFCAFFSNHLLPSLLLRILIQHNN